MRLELSSDSIVVVTVVEVIMTLASKSNNPAEHAQNFLITIESEPIVVAMTEPAHAMRRFKDII